MQRGVVAFLLHRFGLMGARTSTRIGRGVIALWLWTVAAPAAWAEVAVIAGNTNGAPGETIAIPVSLDPGGMAVAALQNDLELDPAVVTPVLHNGKPDCQPDPGTGKTLGTNLLGGATIRALLFSLVDLSPIPAGTLYTCAFRIAPTAVPGDYAIDVANVAASDATGHALGGVTGQGGMLTVTAAPAASVDVGTATGMPGDTVSVAVSLVANGASVAGVQNDITLDTAALAVAEADGNADCTVNPGIGKQLSTAILDGGARLRVIVFSVDDLAPIPDGGLYRCNFSILPTAPPGDVTLVNSGVVVADPQGAVLDSVGHDGRISVTAAACAGDCNDDGAVTVDELVKAAGIALGIAPVATCPTADVDRDGSVIITEILSAVINAQSGCPMR